MQYFASLPLVINLQFVNAGFEFFLPWKTCYRCYLHRLLAMKIHHF